MLARSHEHHTRYASCVLHTHNRFHQPNEPTVRAIASVDLAKVPGGSPKRAGTGGVGGEAYLKYLAATKNALLDLIPAESGGEDVEKPGAEAEQGAGQGAMSAEDNQREDAAGEAEAAEGEGGGAMSYEMAMAMAGMAGYTQQGGAVPMGMELPATHF